MKAAFSLPVIIAISALLSASLCASKNADARSMASNTKSKTTDEPGLRDARARLDGGDAQGCETLVAEFLRSNPDNSAARLLHAQALYKLGRFHFAFDEAAAVLASGADNAKAVLLTAQIDQNLHKPQQAVEMYKKYLQLNPNDEQSGQYQALISVLTDDAAKQQTKRNTVISGTDNYLLAVCTGSYQRWKNPTAIKVYVADGKGVPEYRPEFEDSLRQAFDDWSQSTDGKLAFIFVPDKSKADMTVVWSSDLHAPKFVAEGGYCMTKFGGDGLESADIQLLTVDPFKDGPIGKNYVYNLCLHEIGHALGLVGHSPDPNDIMSTTLTSQQGLSPRDIRTVLALYNADLSAPLPMVDGYGRPLSNLAKADRLSHEAFTALAAQKYQEGVDKYEQALKLDPKTPNAKENIAVALNNLGIADGVSQDKAMELFRRALYYNPSAEYVRSNLNGYLQSRQIDPKSFAARVKLGDEFAAKHDNVSAFVEYGEALRVKDDAVVRGKQDKVK